MAKARRLRLAGTKPFKKDEQIGIILGAGATKACDGPLTVEILPKAFEATKGQQLGLLDGFLQDLFSVPPSLGARKPGDPPGFQKRSPHPKGTGNLQRPNHRSPGLIGSPLLHPTANLNPK